MFKKLFLLVVGAGLAAGGFLYYTSLPEEESAALMASISEQKVNLEKIADNITESELVQQTMEKGKQTLQQGASRLMESTQAEQWLDSTLKRYAEDQDLELSEAQSQELVDKLMELRKFSESAILTQSAAEEPLTPEQQQRFDQMMEEGNATFEQHLGVPLTHFLTMLSKASNQQMIDPQN